MTNNLATPVLLLVFNRPATTRAVIKSLASVRPATLYVAADGPRPEVEGEAELCKEARRVATSVDWECKVRTLFREKHLGCGLGVSSAVDWFFENVAEGIVLEDDCVPSRSFYHFCGELLDYYRDDGRVMHIAGSNFQFGRRRGPADYYFSKYTNVWGWATWRRAWAFYDFNLRPSWELDDTWDTQWQLSVERRNGLAIVPNANLVENIGFGLEASHTKTVARYSNLQTNEIRFPLTHPERLETNRSADILTYYMVHREVARTELVWWYRLWDYFIPQLKRVKRVVLGKRLFF